MCVLGLRYDPEPLGELPWVVLCYLLYRLLVYSAGSVSESCCVWMFCFVQAKTVCMYFLVALVRVGVHVMVMSSRRP